MHEALRTGVLQEEWLACCCAGALLRGVWIQVRRAQSLFDLGRQGAPGNRGRLLPNEPGANRPMQLRAISGNHV
jgi:hypothetical protein